MDHPMASELESLHPGALDRIAEEISDMMWSGRGASDLEEGEDECVFLAGKVTLNACNHALTGSFWLGGVEYAFEAECGDWNGWVWREISADGPIPTINFKPTVWALAPNSALVTDAIAKDKPGFLLAKWDALAAREPYASLPRNYAYDRHFQPGLQIENYYRDKAGSVGFVIVPQEDAEEARKSLADAALKAREDAT